VKMGTSSPANEHQLQNVLRCATCGEVEWGKSPSLLKCGNCGNQLTVTDKAIILD